MALSREEVLAALDARQRAVDPIEVPEWGGTIYARRLSAADLQAFEALKGVDFQIRVLITCLADENGQPLLTEEDAAALAGAEFTVALRLFGIVAEANGLSNVNLEAAMVAFGVAQGDDSSTD